MKTCSKCKEEKELDAYYKDSRRRDGLCSVCRDCVNTRRREVYVTSEGYVTTQLERRYAQRYSVTLLEYKQNMSTSNVCQSCGSNHKLCYDHCHVSGKFRGILCNKCNLSIGNLGDNIEGVEQALSYLKRHYG